MNRRSPHRIELGAPALQVQESGAGAHTACVPRPAPPPRSGNESRAASCSLSGCLQLQVTENLRTEQNSAVAVTFAVCDTITERFLSSFTFHDTKFVLNTDLGNLSTVFLLAY